MLKKDKIVTMQPISKTRLYELKERNAKRRKVNPTVALERLADELEAEADYLEPIEEESSANIRYAAAFIRVHFCEDRRVGHTDEPKRALAAC